jgi:uncharacterized protein YjeT (DUF2065 family)
VQTKLSEFLRHGAAGSSGAVQEPYSFIEKFPVPQLHRYYADGCSLAEAFYQSISSPYQLIVVGDPLTRPFARFAELALEAPDPDRPWRGVVDLQARLRMPPGERPDRLELWIDGRRLGQGGADAPLALDTRTLADGWHELRLVVVAQGTIETRSYRRWPIQVNNHERRVSLRAPRDALAYGEVLQLSGEAGPAQRLHIRQGGRVLAEVAVDQGRWQARLDTTQLGPGPVALQAEAHYADGGTARSAPLPLQVLPVEADPGQAHAAAGQPGLLARVQKAKGGEQTLVLEGLTGGLGPRAWRRLKPLEARYSGRFETRAAGLYELVLEAVGEVSLHLNGSLLYEGTLAAEAGGTRLSLPLEPGWQGFEISVRTTAPALFPRFTLAGPEAPFLLEGERVRHE